MSGKTSTKKKACVACQINRRKCGSERPCQRCTKLSIPCVDRIDRRKSKYRGKGRSDLTTLDKDMIESVALPASSKSDSVSVGAQIAMRALRAGDSPEAPRQVPQPKGPKRNSRRKQSSKPADKSAATGPVDSGSHSAALALASLGQSAIPAPPASASGATWQNGVLLRGSGTSVSREIASNTSHGLSAPVWSQVHSSAASAAAAGGWITPTSPREHYEAASTQANAQPPSSLPVGGTLSQRIGVADMLTRDQKTTGPGSQTVWSQLDGAHWQPEGNRGNSLGGALVASSSSSIGSSMWNGSTVNSSNSRPTSLDVAGAAAGLAPAPAARGAASAVSVADRDSKKLVQLGTGIHVGFAPQDTGGTLASSTGPAPARGGTGGSFSFATALQQSGGRGWPGLGFVDAHPDQVLLAVSPPARDSHTGLDDDESKATDRVSSRAMTVSIHRGMPTPRMLVQRDSRGTVRVLFGRSRVPANMSMFLSSRGYNWVWRGPRTLGALQRRILPGGRPDLPSGANSKRVLRYLADRDAEQASRLSSSSVACFRGIVHPETMQFAQGVMNRAAAKAVAAGSNPVADAMERCKVIDLPENMPIETMESSSKLLGALLQRQRQVVYRLDVLRYAICDEVSGAACMTLVGLHQQLDTRKGKLQAEIAEALSAGSVGVEAFDGLEEELLVEPQRLDQATDGEADAASIAFDQPRLPSRPASISSSSSSSRGAGARIASSAGPASSASIGSLQSQLGKVNQAIDEVRRFVEDRMLCSRLKCNMAAVLEWLGSVPRAVTMVVIPIETPLDVGKMQSFELPPASSCTPAELAKLIDEALEEQGAAAPLARFGDAPAGQEIRSSSSASSTNSQPVPDRSQTSEHAAAAESSAVGESKPGIGSKRKRSDSMDTSFSCSDSVSGMSLSEQATEHEDALEFAMELGLPMQDPVVEVIRDAFEFNVDPFAGCRASVGLDLLGGDGEAEADDDTAAAMMTDADDEDGGADHVSGNNKTRRAEQTVTSSSTRHIGHQANSQDTFRVVSESEAPVPAAAFRSTGSQQDERDPKRIRIESGWAGNSMNEGAESQDHRVTMRVGNSGTAGPSRAETAEQPPLDSVGSTYTPASGHASPFGPESHGNASPSSVPVESKPGSESSESSGGEWSSISAGSVPMKRALRTFQKVATMSIGAMAPQSSDDSASGGAGQNGPDGIATGVELMAGPADAMGRVGSKAQDKAGGTTVDASTSLFALEGLFQTRQVVRVSELRQFQNLFDQARRPSGADLRRVDEEVMAASHSEDW